MPKKSAPKSAPKAAPSKKSVTSKIESKSAPSPKKSTAEPTKKKGPVKKGSSEAFASRVSNLQDAWAKSKQTAAESVNSYKNENLGNGYYPAKLVSVRFGVPQKKGSDIFWISKYVIVGSDCEGETISSYDTLSTKENSIGQTGMTRLCDRIVRTGYDVPDDPAGLEALAKEMAADKPLVELKVVWSADDKYQNANVVRSITEEDFNEVYAKNSAQSEESEE